MVTTVVTSGVPDVPGGTEEAVKGDAADRTARWWHRFGPRTLAGRFLVLQLAVVGLVLLVAGVVSVRQAISQFSDSSGDRVLGAAENLAGNPLLRELPTMVVPGQLLAPTAEAARVQSGASWSWSPDPTGPSPPRPTRP